LRPKTTSRPLRWPQDRTRPKFRPTDLNSRLKLWDPISSRRLTRPCSRCPSSWSCNYAPLSNNQFDALPSCSGSPNSPEFSNENSASTTHPGSGLTTFEQAARRQYSRYVTNLQRSQPAVLQTLALSVQQPVYFGQIPQPQRHLHQQVLKDILLFVSFLTTFEDFSRHFAIVT